MCHSWRCGARVTCRSAGSCLRSSPTAHAARCRTCRSSSRVSPANDDHPHADIRNGQAFLNLVYRAVTSGPAWPRTVLVINYDEWGGFFDHVPPPVAPIPPADYAAGDDEGLLGFRVPCVIVSPLARRKHVSHVPFDHTSVLRMIEWRWGLEPLTVRDATANNLAEALDFSQPPRLAAQYWVPPGPFGGPCGLLATDAWAGVAKVARSHGWR
jgi:phospholipase C